MTVIGGSIINIIKGGIKKHEIFFGFDDGYTIHMSFINYEESDSNLNFNLLIILCQLHDSYYRRIGFDGKKEKKKEKKGKKCNHLKLT